MRYDIAIEVYHDMDKYTDDEFLEIIEQAIDKIKKLHANEMWELNEEDYDIFWADCIDEANKMLGNQ